MAFLVQLAQQLAAHGRSALLTPGQQQVLQDGLRLMRDLCARDDSGRGLAAGGGSGGADLVRELQAAGFLPAVLAMLKALAPIQNPQRQQEAAAAAAEGGAGGSSAAGGIQVAELAPALAQQAARFPAAPPYVGFRTDALAVISNAAHGRPSVQASAWGAGTGCLAVGEHACLAVGEHACLAVGEHA